MQSGSFRLALLVVAAALLSQKLSAAEPEKGAEEKPLSVAAEQVVEVFTSNQAAVDELLEGHVLHVTGRVDQIFRSTEGFERQEGGRVYVVEMSVTSSRGDAMPLQFVFSVANRKQLVNLRPGNVMTIEAKCEGEMNDRLNNVGGIDANAKSIRFLDARVVNIQVPRPPASADESPTAPPQR